MPKKVQKTENKLALYGVTDASIVDLAEKKAEATKLVPLLRAAPCGTPDQYKWASEQLANLRAIRNALDESRTNITKPMNAAKRAVDQLFSPIKTFDECIEILWTKITAYDRAQLKLQQAALAQATEAAQKGDMQAAALAIDAMPETVEGEGHSTAKTLSFRVTDFSKVSDTLKQLDESAVKNIIRAWEKSGSMELPVYDGIEFELDVKQRAKPV